MKFYRFGRALAGLIVRLIFRMRYEGTENIPAGGGYIIACNHLSVLDPILLAQKVAPQIRYIAKYELTRIPVIGFCIKHLGIVPVKRGEGDGGAIDQSVELIKQGAVLGIFPEGTRSKTGKPLRPRSGVSVITGQTGAPVLPVGISYGRKRFRSAVTVRFGKMIPNDSLGIDLASPSTLRAGSKLIMSEIIALLEPEDGTQ